MPIAVDFVLSDGQVDCGRDAREKIERETNEAREEREERASLRRGVGEGVRKGE